MLASSLSTRRCIVRLKGLAPRTRGRSPLRLSAPDLPFGEFDLYVLGPKVPRRGLLGRGTLVYFDG
jgi:hypothetical protein